MKCAQGISADELARLWLDDLSEEDATRLEDHLFECAACEASLRRFAAIGQGVRIAVTMQRLPPLLTAEQLAALQASGMRLDVEHLVPGATSMRPVDPSLDGLVWMLHAELTAVQSVTLEVCSPDGRSLLLLPSAPVDRESGAVILACGRHTAQVARASRIRLLDGERGNVLAEYRLIHPAVESL
jgi:hypothetical protein